jgi:hypothetical protein
LGDTPAAADGHAPDMNRDRLWWIGFAVLWIVLAALALILLFISR